MKPDNCCSRSPWYLQCWNWKCALMSAVARSCVYATAMLHTGAHGGPGSGRAAASIILVEMIYVTLTAGIYAGLQQAALGLRQRRLGDLAIVIGVPGLAQSIDWLIHRLVGAPPAKNAVLSIVAFTLLSALFHRHVMRRGAFLTGAEGQSLVDDFRVMPRLVAGFAARPAIWVAALPAKFSRDGDFEAAA